MQTNETIQRFSVLESRRLSSGILLPLGTPGFYFPGQKTTVLATAAPTPITDVSLSPTTASDCITYYVQSDQTFALLDYQNYFTKY